MDCQIKTIGFYKLYVSFLEDVDRISDHFLVNELTKLYTDDRDQILTYLKDRDSLKEYLSQQIEMYRQAHLEKTKFEDLVYRFERAMLKGEKFEEELDVATMRKIAKEFALDDECHYLSQRGNRYYDLRVNMECTSQEADEIETYDHLVMFYEVSLRENPDLEMVLRFGDDYKARNALNLQMLKSDRSFDNFKVYKLIYKYSRQNLLVGRSTSEATDLKLLLFSINYGQRELFLDLYQKYPMWSELTFDGEFFHLDGNTYSKVTYSKVTMADLTIDWKYFGRIVLSKERI